MFFSNERKMRSILIHLSGNMWADTADNIATGSGFKVDLNDQFHEKTWHDITEFAAHKGFNCVVIDLGNAIKYESHPEIASKNAWSVEKLKSELDRLRELGITPIPKLNFSASHDTWLGKYERMLCTDIYYKVCKELILEVSEIFGRPQFFHLGMDEEDAFTPEFLGYRFGCFRQFELYWHDWNYLFDCVREAGVRPWVWVAIKDKESSLVHNFSKYVDKDVLVNPYYYGRFYFADHCYIKGNKAEVSENLLDRFNDFRRFMDAGYDIVPCGSTFETNLNIPDMVRFAKENLESEHMFGLMTAPWYLTQEWLKYAIMNDIQQLSYALDEL